MFIPWTIILSTVGGWVIEKFPKPVYIFIECPIIYVSKMFGSMKKIFSWASLSIQNLTLNHFIRESFDNYANDVPY